MNSVELIPTPHLQPSRDKACQEPLRRKIPVWPIAGHGGGFYGLFFSQALVASFWENAAITLPGLVFFRHVEGINLPFRGRIGRLPELLCRFFSGLCISFRKNGETGARMGSVELISDTPAGDSPFLWEAVISGSSATTAVSWETVSGEDGF